MTTTSHGAFSIERLYAAAPQRVFAAWADPVAKRSWFAEGKGSEVQSYHLDFRNGGAEIARYRFLKGEEVFGKETTFGNDTAFNEIIPSERIIFTYAMSRDGVRFSVSLATVEFRAAENGTRLLFTEHGAFFDDADGAQMREAGWRDLLASLERHLMQ